MRHRLFFIALLAIFFCKQAKAQEHQPKSDSLKYAAIEKFSEKRKFTKFLHKLIFRTVVPEKSRQPKKNRAVKQKPYRKVEGKIVRQIHVITFDPFGYHIQDTTMHPQGFLPDAGNKLHVKTQPWVVKNLLLFKKNEPFDSLLVKESERLVRTQKFVQDVVFYTLPVSKTTDSVDVYIRVYDVWSIIPAFAPSATNAKFGLTDNNFVGFGHRLQVEKQWKIAPGVGVTQLKYGILNIRNSYITANLEYSFSDTCNLVKSIDLERTFYSPLTKWAGGIYLGQIMTNLTYLQNDTIHKLSSTANIGDFWGAKSWQIFKGNSENARTTRLILSARLLSTKYPDKPPESEPANVFNKQTIYFTGLGISSRKYVQDSYIFNFGKVEDVPVGRAFGITTGIEKQQTNRIYLGLQASWGNYYHFGYLSTHLEYGTFIGTTGLQQEVITGRINYTTRLFSLGSWKVRQFANPILIFGINRLPTDNLTFVEGIKGFEELAYRATQMMVLRLQTQSYAPWNLVGFHFGPFLFASLGMLGNEETGFSHSRLYSVIGFGLLIKNDYLIFNTFQVSLSFYPSLPGNGSNVFKTNGYVTSDYGFRDFEIGKPEVVIYR